MNGLLYPSGMLFIQVLLKLILAIARYEVALPAARQFHWEGIVFSALGRFFQNVPLSDIARG